MAGRPGAVAAGVAGRVRGALPRDDMRSWTVLAVLLTLLDAAATWAWLSTGLAREGNPLVLALIDTYGPTFGLLARSLIGVTFVAGLTALAVRHRVAGHALMLATAALGAVAVWHAAGVGLIVG